MGPYPRIWHLKDQDVFFSIDHDALLKMSRVSCMDQSIFGL